MFHEFHQKRKWQNNDNLHPIVGKAIGTAWKVVSNDHVQAYFGKQRLEEDGFSLPPEVEFF